MIQYPVVGSAAIFVQFLPDYTPFDGIEGVQNLELPEIHCIPLKIFRNMPIILEN